MEDGFVSSDWPSDAADERPDSETPADETPAEEPATEDTATEDTASSVGTQLPLKQAYSFFSSFT